MASGADGDREGLERAVAAVLKSMGRRERTAAEARALLERRGLGPDAVDEGLRRLMDLGAVDDSRFARAFADDKRELGGWGPERIAAALRARGIEDRLVAAATGSEGRDEQLERARDLLRRRGDELADAAACERALGFLVRRGYDLDLAYEAIRSLARAA